MRICAHARKITEMWRAQDPKPPEDTPAHIVGEKERMAYSGWTRVIDIDDSPQNWQCGWRAGDMPVPVARSAGGNSLRAGDCDTCRFFEPVNVVIPGVQQKKD